MTKTILQFTLMFIVLVITQSLIFNRIALFSMALAFIFIYFIIRLPVTLSTARVISLSFLIGFCVDVFGDTPGMNALACTCLGGIRQTVLRLYVPREEDMSRTQPTIRSLGAAVYARYVVTMSLIFCALVFMIEALSFFNGMVLLTRILASTLLTSALLFAADSLSYKPSRE